MRKPIVLVTLGDVSPFTRSVYVVEGGGILVDYEAEDSQHGDTILDESDDTSGELGLL